MFKLLLLLLLVYVASSILVLLLADSMIHHPPFDRYGSSDQHITFQASDGLKLVGIWKPNPKAEYTILFSHGNGEDLGSADWFLDHLRSIGFNVFAYDYRGYGRSEGKPSEKGLFRDIEAAYSHVTRELKIPPDRLILHGRSLGSGPSTYLASKHPCAGLILESPYTSTFRVVLPFNPFFGDQFQNLKRIKNINCPLLVIHGKNDSVISFSHGLKLFNEAKEPKHHLWIENADHNDIMMVAQESYLKSIQQFAKSLK